MIGRRGAEADRLRAGLLKITGNPKIHFNIQEIKQPELDATLIAQGVADQLAGRVSLPSGDEARGADRDEGRRRRASACSAAAASVAPRCRRKEWYREGRVPLHTLRADIDYGQAEARTTFGRIGVKVWIYKGEILPYKSAAEDKIAKEAAMAVGETAGGRRSAGSSAPVAVVAARPTSPSPVDGRRRRPRTSSKRPRPW